MVWLSRRQLWEGWSGRINRSRQSLGSSSARHRQGRGWSFLAAQLLRAGHSQSRGIGKNSWLYSQISQEVGNQGILILSPSIRNGLPCLANAEKAPSRNHSKGGSGVDVGWRPLGRPTEITCSTPPFDVIL